MMLFMTPQLFLFLQDVVERIWDFIDDFNINSVVKFLKDNIIGTVVVVSLLFWIPISCLVSYVDRKRAEKVRERLNTQCLCRSAI